MKSVTSVHEDSHKYLGLMIQRDAEQKLEAAQTVISFI